MTIHPVSGIRLASAIAEIGYKGRDDLVLIELAPGTQTAALFTSNAFKSAPVIVAKEHLEQAIPKYLLVNAGNANAGTSQDGIAVAHKTCELVTQHTDAEVTEVLPFSTGVIGQDMPVEPFVRALPNLVNKLDQNNWQQAAKAIMTTDTVEKVHSKQIDLNGDKVVITGICKGSGMICPDMATMLAYVATDARIAQAELQEILREAAEHSFNAISVDGDTSPNDALVLMATGQGVEITTSNKKAFTQAIIDLCYELARAIIKDGEGATRLVDVTVSQARSIEEAREVAYRIAHSPLVKTALFAGDPNWGRILAAVGRSNIERLDINTVSIYLGDLCVVENGRRDPDYTEQAGREAFSKSEYGLRVTLSRGKSSATIMTCDLSYDYVKINADYRNRS